MIFDTLYIQIIFRKHVIKMSIYIFKIGNSKMNTNISKELTIHYTKKDWLGSQMPMRSEDGCK